MVETAKVRVGFDRAGHTIKNKTCNDSCCFMNPIPKIFNTASQSKQNCTTRIQGDLLWLKPFFLLKLIARPTQASSWVLGALGLCPHSVFFFPNRHHFFLFLFKKCPRGCNHLERTRYMQLLLSHPLCVAALSQQHQPGCGLSLPRSRWHKVTTGAHV